MHDSDFSRLPNYEKKCFKDKINRKRLNKIVGQIYLKVVITGSIFLDRIQGSSFSHVDSC